MRMKLTKLSCLIAAFLVFSQSIKGEEGGVWFFPPSSFAGSLKKYEEKYDFDKKYILNFVETRVGYGDYPFIVIDESSIFFRDTIPVTRIEKSTVQVESDGFLMFSDKKNRWLAITGGGYFASNRIPHSNSELFVAELKRLYETRSKLLESKVDEIFPSLFDNTLILPQVIKTVRMSAPFLEETIRGLRHRYDDDMLLYRWFYKYLNRGLVAMYFINDPTPMVEGAPGNGVGLTLDIDYHIPSDNLVVLNGFVDLDRRHLYKLNARMKKVLVQGDSFELKYEFQDHVHFAQIDFPKKVNQIRLTVQEVYDGSRYDDLCISGLFTNPDVLNTRNSPLAYELLEEAKKEWQEKR